MKKEIDLVELMNRKKPELKYYMGIEIDKCTKKQLKSIINLMALQLEKQYVQTIEDLF